MRTFWNNQLQAPRQQKEFESVGQSSRGGLEVRGTDASGIAYVKNGRLVIYKKPLPTHKIRFCVPSDTTIVMGHTRMTTQGAAKFNYNNHPFMGRTEEGSFALCHNGMLYNDRELAISEELPATPI